MYRALWRTVSLLVLLAPHAVSSRAAAQAIVLRRPALHWVRSEGALSCIDPRKLAEHVESLIGPVLVRPSEAEHTIEGQVDAVGPGRLRVRVRVLDAAGHKVGEREFEQPADSCSKLTPAIVFVIGMAIDPEVGAHGLPPALVALLGGPPPAETLLEELERAPAAVAHPLRGGGPGEARPRQQKPAPQLEDARRLQASLFAREAYKEAPRLVSTLDARLLWALKPPLAVGAYLRGGAQNGRHEVGGDRKLSVSLFDAGLLTCLGARSENLIRLQGCMGTELSLALGAAHGPGATQSGWVAAFGLVVQLTARVRIAGPWGVGLLFTSRFSAPRRSFSIDNGSTLPNSHVARLTNFSGGLGIGPTFEF